VVTQTLKRETDLRIETVNCLAGTHNCAGTGYVHQETKGSRDEMFSIQDIIDLAIQIEENGEQVYRRASGEISNPSLVWLLQYLADEETEHARWFSELNWTKSSKKKRLTSVVCRSLWTAASRKHVRRHPNRNRKRRPNLFETLQISLLNT
jgi:hypothetical protein